MFNVQPLNTPRPPLLPSPSLPLPPLVIISTSRPLTSPSYWLLSLLIDALLPLPCLEDLSAMVPIGYWRGEHHTWHAWPTSSHPSLAVHLLYSMALKAFTCATQYLAKPMQQGTCEVHNCHHLYLILGFHICSGVQPGKEDGVRLIWVSTLTSYSRRLQLASDFWVIDSVNTPWWLLSVVSPFILCAAPDNDSG